MYKLKTFLICAIIIITNTIVNADNSTNSKLYKSQDHKQEKQVDLYTEMKSSASRYLSYRDLPDLLKQYVHGTKALDYGSGTGLSTQFLLEQGYEVTGVDVSSAMLEKTKKALPKVKFSLIKNGALPYLSNIYDLVFSSLVLFEISNEKEMLKYLLEAKRVMKKNGIFVVLTGAEAMYSNKNLYSFYNDYPENSNLKSGKLVKVKLPDIDLTFEDYYWSENDYKESFKKAGFNIIETHYPLGKKGEPYPWKEEKSKSPFVIFIMQKE
ncbi:class I SAM-dependent methyltransferase [Rickettsia endosymbiont of Halotydeus destructor]|uniref:class I SAM-dependent methyltransferase n=1 Tax=Rickettsia endosymbiont of Halotydeus destructor TaxID=2996754 RepID=UPI003BB0FAEE